MTIVDPQAQGIRPGRRLRWAALAAGGVWLGFVVVTRLALHPGATLGPNGFARRWSLAGALAGLALGWAALPRGRHRILSLTGLAVLSAAVFAAVFASTPAGAGADGFLALAVASLILYGIPVALILYGCGVGATTDP